jgi:transcriptional regulator with XRE-family HTH domain
MSTGPHSRGAGTSGRKKGAGSIADGGPTYLRIVAQVTESGMTQQELGAVVGASVRSVQNWASGAAVPSGIKAKRLLDVKYIVDELRTVYTEEGVNIWLHARNRNLGGARPIELLTQGELDEVVREVQRISGAM